MWQEENPGDECAGPEDAEENRQGQVNASAAA